MSENTRTRLKEVAVEWREARRIYPIYAALIARFDLPVPPCHFLDSPVDSAEPEAIEHVREWLELADESIEASHLRQVLQSTSLGTEASIRSLVQRYLARPDAAESYRDRIDFLLAQYFSQNASPKAARGIVSLDEVSAVLESVIGPNLTGGPAWLNEFEQLLARLDGFRSLRDLLGGGVLEQGRVLKSRYSSDYLQPAVLAAITRYNFLVRRNFIRLLHHDLERIHKVTTQLQQQGAKAIDCSSAGFGNSATPDEVLRFVANWKAIFRKDYSERQVCLAVVKVLDSCERELRAAPAPAAQAAKAPVPSVTVPVSQKTAAATAPAHSKPSAPAVAPTPQPIPVVQSPILPSSVEIVEKELKKVDEAQVPVHPRFALHEVLESFAEQLFAAELQNTHLATAAALVGDCKVLLSSWEVAAFLKGGDDLSDTLQQAVAARGIVAEAVDRRKRTGSAADLKPIIALGRAEVARLQERIAQARDARNIDAAVNLAATQKRLAQILDEAAKF